MSISIFATGGTGINLGSKFEEVKNSKNVAIEPISISYIDTSESNIRHNKISKESLYLVENANGSGKNRAENYESIKEQVKKILLVNKPEEFNIVIASCGGGSGSVIAPLLVNELLEQKKAVVAVLVGSSDSTIEIKNTINTLKSFIGISNKRQESVVAFYYENSKETPRSEVDSRVESAITILSMFLSRNNHELDYTDVYNFLHFEKVTSHDSNFVIAKFYKDVVEPESNCIPIAALTLAKHGQDTHTGDASIDYQGVGFVSDVTASGVNNINDILPNHFTILEGCVSKIIGNLEAKLKEVNTIREASVIKKVKVTDALDDGMVI